MNLTGHATKRLFGRRLTPAALDLVVVFGRELHVRGATIYVVGRKEVLAGGEFDVDLTVVEGVHVVCDRSGRVLTAYRNRSLRGLKPEAWGEKSS